MLRRVKTGVNVSVGHVQQVQAIERIGHVDGKRGVTVGWRQSARGDDDGFGALRSVGLKGDARTFPMPVNTSSTIAAALANRWLAVRSTRPKNLRAAFSNDATGSGEFRGSAARCGSPVGVIASAGADGAPPLPAAILAADVAGYSRLMGEDEESAIFLYVAIRHHYQSRSYLGIFTVPPFCVIRHDKAPAASRE